MTEEKTCLWIGEGEGCNKPAIHKKSYCERHYVRVYETYLPEMAQYVMDKEVETKLENTG